MTASNLATGFEIVCIPYPFDGAAVENAEWIKRSAWRGGEWEGRARSRSSTAASEGLTEDNLIAD